MATSSTKLINNKASISIIENGAIAMTYVFQYNPTERAWNHVVNYSMASPPGSALPYAFFSNIDGPIMSLSILLDATVGYRNEREGVRAQKAFFESLVQPDVDQYIDDLGTFTAPPEARFSMGGEDFPVVFTKCNFRDVRFNLETIETRTWVELDMLIHSTDPSWIKTRLEKLKRLRNLVVTR